jgi:hypothetical protein
LGKKSHFLYKLIKSLNPGEKRYFHRFSKRHVLGEGNQYLALFTALDSQAAYHEEKAKDAIGHLPSASYYPVAKNQLSSLILDSLDMYYAGKSVEAQRRKEFRQAELLAERGFLPEARKRIKKLQKKVRAYPLLELELIRLERKVWLREGGKWEASEIQASTEREQELLTLQLKEATYAGLLTRLYPRVAEKGKATSEVEKEELIAFMDQPLLKEGSAPAGLRAKLYFHQIWSTYYFLLDEMELAIDHNRKRLALLESEPEEILANPGAYLSAVNNYLVDCLSLGRDSELQRYIRHLLAFAEEAGLHKVAFLPGAIFRISSQILLNDLIARSRFQEAMEMIPELEKGLERHSAHIKSIHRHTLYYLIAYAAFGAEAWNVSLKWVNRLLNEREKESLIHLQAVSRLFSVILHFELGNLDILEDQLRSAKRFIRAQGMWTDYEEAVFQAFRAILGDQNRKTRQIWIKLDADLEKLPAPASQQYFDLLAWVKKKSR